MSLFSKHRRESKFPDAPSFSSLVGEDNIMVGRRIRISDLFGEPIVVVRGRIMESKKRADTKCLQLQVEYDGVMRILFTGSAVLLRQMLELERSQNPNAAAEFPVKLDKPYECKVKPFKAIISKINKYVAFE